MCAHTGANGMPQVDGVVVDLHMDGHRAAFNKAFASLVSFFLLRGLLKASQPLTLLPCSSLLCYKASRRTITAHFIFRVSIVCNGRLICTMTCSDEGMGHQKASLQPILSSWVGQR